MFNDHKKGGESRNSICIGGGGGGHSFKHNFYINCFIYFAGIQTLHLRHAFLHNVNSQYILLLNYSTKDNAAGIKSEIHLQRRCSCSIHSFVTLELYLLAPVFNRGDEPGYNITPFTF